MNILALTPDEFQAIALGWLAAVTLVGGALLTAVLKFWPQIVELKAKIDALHTRQDDQANRQDVQAANIANVALAVQPQTPPVNPPQ